MPVLAPKTRARTRCEYCQCQDWEIAGDYIDLCSGKTAQREQFQAMFAAAYQRQFDVV